MGSYKYEQRILIVCCYLWLLALSSVSVYNIHRRTFPPPLPVSHKRPISSFARTIYTKILGEMLEFKYLILRFYSQDFTEAG